MKQVKRLKKFNKKLKTIISEQRSDIRELIERPLGPQSIMIRARYHTEKCLETALWHGDASMPVDKFSGLSNYLP